MPLKRLKLKQLVKLFAEVLRENDLVEDIERDAECHRNTLNTSFNMKMK